MTLAVITQPTYLSWLGYFEQLARADVFVFLDDVPFRKRSWICRNRLRTKDGATYWLTVPVTESPREMPINRVCIIEDGGYWEEAHKRSITSSLAKSKYFGAVEQVVEKAFAQRFEMLADLNKYLIREIAGLLGLSPLFLSSSDIDVEGRRTEKLVNICRAVGADEYYSAAGSQEYMEEDSHLFKAAGIRYHYQDFAHPEYQQVGQGFVSHLACIDMIANVGPGETGRVLRVAAGRELRVS